jgi:hypothetical protein
MDARWRPIAVAVGVIAVTGAMVGGVATADDDEVKLEADLSGANEVPPADPDGTGFAKLSLDVDGGEVCFELRVDDTGTPNRGHIHVGAAGTNGGIVVTFFELAGDPADPRHDQLENDGELEACVAAGSDQLQAIAEDPAGYYVNLHNARFPGGAVRGQLEDG